MIKCQNVKGSVGWNPRTFYSDLFLMARSISSLKTDDESRQRLGNGLWTKISIKFYINSFLSFNTAVSSLKEQNWQDLLILQHADLSVL